MFLLIFESIGTSELILIGIIALIFLGPRRLPEIAHKMGKIMADLRNTTNEFKQTWEREVNFEEEAKAIRTGDLPDAPVPRINPPAEVHTEGVSAPEIKAIDATAFTATAQPDAERPEAEDQHSEPEHKEYDLADKRNWL